MAKPTVFFIVGATATGKTAAAVDIALKVGGEVISADAIQIYRGLDKGSAKPDSEEMKGVPHHFIDIVDYTCDDYNAARFSADALKCIEEIIRRGRVPIVAGGTGLYVNSLVYPLNFTAVKPNELLRAALIADEEASPGTLYERLRMLDADAAARLHPNDTKRIVRALEVCLTTGTSLTAQAGDFLNTRNTQISIRPIMAGITMDRALLYQRINRRVDIMLENGLVDEAKRLYDACGSRDIHSMQAIGYKQLIAWFEGECTYEEAVEAIKRETRRFAKRQIAWFKRDDRIRWFDALEYDTPAKLYDAMYDYFVKETANGGEA